MTSELAIRHEGDEKLLACDEYARFLAPLYATTSGPGGDIVNPGSTSRTIDFRSVEVFTPTEDSDSSAEVHPDPIVVAVARGTTVVRRIGGGASEALSSRSLDPA